MKYYNILNFTDCINGHCGHHKAVVEWVCCCECETWFHCFCVGIDYELAKTIEFQCQFCQQLLISLIHSFGRGPIIDLWVCVAKLFTEKTATIEKLFNTISSKVHRQGSVLIPCMNAFKLFTMHSSPCPPIRHFSRTQDHPKNFFDCLLFKTCKLPFAYTLHI